MRTLGVVVLAIGLALATAWGVTKWEFRHAEQPLAAVVENQPRSDQAPQVVVEGDETFHFGTMDVSATKSHTFIIKNVGTAPLALHKGHTSCKCTLSELDQGLVQPGSSTEVRLEWHPPAATPEFEQSAEIATNDPQRPMIQLKIRGRVLDALTLDPANLVVGDVSVNEAHSFTAKIWSFRPEPLELKSWEFVESNVSPYFTLRAEPIPAEEVKAQADATAGYKLLIDLKAGAPLAAFTQKVKLHHNYDGIEPLELSISGKAVGDITIISPKYVADKDYLEFGNIVRSRGYQTKVYLLVKGPRRETIKFNVQNVDPAETLQVTIGEPSRPSDKSVLWPIDIEIPTGAETVSRIGSELERLARITLTTNDSITPQVVLRVRVAVVEE